MRENEQMGNEPSNLSDNQSILSDVRESLREPAEDPEFDLDSEEVVVASQKRKVLPLIIAGVVGVIVLLVVLLVVFGESKTQEIPFGQVGQPIATAPYPVQLQSMESQAPIPEPVPPVPLDASGVVTPGIPEIVDADSSVKPPAQMSAEMVSLLARVSQVESQYSELIERFKDLEKKVDTPRKQAQTRVVAPVKKAATQNQQKAVEGVMAGYSLQAIIPGQAWISLGRESVVVHVGDVLPSGAKVRSIEPDKHEVVTTYGVIR